MVTVFDYFVAIANSNANIRGNKTRNRSNIGSIAARIALNTVASKSVMSTEAIAVVVYVTAVSLQIAALATWSQCSRTDFVIITLASQSTLLMLQVLFSLPAVLQYFVFVVAA